MPTDRYQVVEAKLQATLGAESSLAAWIADKRMVSPPWSWQVIAIDLWRLTGVLVNPETLRRWHKQQQPGKEGK